MDSSQKNDLDAIFKYWAFISYRHSDNDPVRDGLNNRWADWLHGQLERYRTPKELVGTQGRDGIVPERIYPIFQDDKELPTSADLGEMIRKALEQSRYLIVLCSPRAVESKYVNEEIRYFKSLGRGNKILPLIIAGEPNASEGKNGFSTGGECLPESLRFKISPNGQLRKDVRDTEPICADARGEGAVEITIQNQANHELLERAKLKLLAGVLGVNFDTLAEREKARQLAEARAKHRRVVLISITIALLGIIASWNWFEANRNEKRALNQAEIALRETRKAKLTLSESYFLQGIDKITQDDATTGLAYLANAIRNHPDKRHPAAASRIINYFIHNPNILTLCNALQHESRVTSTSISPDGTKILTTSMDNTARIWDAISGTPLVTIRDENQIKFATFSPDGAKILTVELQYSNPDEEGQINLMSSTAKIFDTYTGKFLSKRMQHNDEILSAVFNSDGTKIATASADGTAQIWDVSGKPYGKPMKHSSKISKILFSRDGKKLITATDDYYAEVWDVATSSKAIRSTFEHGVESRINSFLGSRGGYHSNRYISPDGTKLVTFSLYSPEMDKDRAVIWDAITGKKISALKSPEFISSAVFSPDGKKIITLSIEGGINVWDTSSGLNIQKNIIHNKEIVSINYQPGVDYAIITTLDNSIILFDINNNTIKKINEYIDLKIDSIYSDERKILISAHQDDGIANIYYVNIYPGFLGTKIIFNKNDKFIFNKENMRVSVIREGGSLQMININNNKIISKSKIDIEKTEFCKFSPDGTKLTTIADEEVLQLWDTATGKLLMKYQIGNLGDHGSVEFSPDGTKLAIIADQGALHLWGTATGKLLMKYDISGTDNDGSIQFSPDGTKLATTSNEGCLQLWDATTGKLLMKYQIGDLGDAGSVKFSPDGTKLATTTNDGVTQLWDSATGHPLTAPMKHRGKPFSIQFSPDFTKFVIISSDNDWVWVWDVSKGIPLIDPIKNLLKPHQATFNPDGTWIITNSLAGVQIWDIATGRSLIDTYPQADFVEFNSEQLYIIGESKRHDNQEISVFPVAPPVTLPAPDWLPLLAEAIIGSKIDDQGMLTSVPPGLLSQFRKRFQLSKETDPYSKIARWLFTDPSNRPPSPYHSILPEN